MTSAVPPAAACPHLASLRDPTTFYAYPSAANRCGRFELPAPLPGSYQSHFCLGARHRQCPLASPSWSGAFPPELRAGAERDWGRLGARPRRRWALWILLALLLLGAMAAAGWFLSSSRPPAPAAAGEQAPTLAPPVGPTEVPSATPAPSPTPAPSATPTPAATDTPVGPFTPTPGPELETPIGAALTYLIHSIRDGESLSFLAQTYGSSVEAIQAANALGSLPLWIGQLVVIPAGISDPAGVPMFAVVRVAETGETLPDLAARDGADPEDIRRYNALGDDPWLPPGRWLIVPLP